MKIYGYLPVKAMAKFSMKTPDNWNEMSKEKKNEYFVEHAKRDASLCYQCVKDTDTDYDIDYDAIQEINWWEE